ncbi:MAG: prephenate dehydrogenase/arogenate dehydrogenase family protein [Candidatus Omnitrophica bacterium]|nr:prephenate dehydrogenase/arogenate dehydrogenase family protein [Candidatus Omnitrophota bacterium]MBL7151480.1 prephenate dehydrogenase/arogenate dehydrogenase family protein [Candidatus Omnitrophota bacterium]
MRLFNKIAIIGTGLIGGSLALAIKKKGLAGEVVGVSRKKATLLSARKAGAIDRGSRNLSIIKGADLVVLAIPVDTIIDLAPRIRRFIDRNCLVTDVGSTKERIVSSLNKIFPNYVGAHPLAGSEKRGILNASPGIFKGSLCILTPTAKTASAALTKINLLWKRVGAKVVFLTPAMHDRILAFTSHLPHIIAFSLISAIPDKYLPLSSTGLRDTTRIAASDDEIWEKIIFSNREQIINSISAFESSLSRIKRAVQRKDRKAVTRFLTQAKSKRDTL